MPAKAKKPEARRKIQKKSEPSAPILRRSKDKNPVVRIDKTMRVAEILALLPDSEQLLAQHGLSCFNCSANAIENLEEGWRSHGYSDEELGDLVNDLNEMLQDRPVLP